MMHGQPWSLAPGEETISREAAEFCADYILTMTFEDLPVALGNTATTVDATEPG